MVVNDAAPSGGGGEGGGSEAGGDGGGGEDSAGEGSGGAGGRGEGGGDNAGQDLSLDMHRTLTRLRKTLSGTRARRQRIMAFVAELDHDSALRQVKRPRPWP